MCIWHSVPLIPASLDSVRFDYAHIKYNWNKGANEIYCSDKTSQLMGIKDTIDLTWAFLDFFLVSSYFASKTHLH